MHKVITPTQCGCRRRRSTTDHLVRLESVIIRVEFVNSEHFISVFFDQEKAYDRTWRHGIVMDVHRVGLRVRVPVYIAEFLKHRILSVKIGNHMSERKVQQNGVPQSSVLSVTLLL